MSILECEICFEHLGQFDPDTIRLPLRGDMFAPLEDGYLPPFNPDIDWEHMRCPLCRVRPMVEEHRIRTPDGYVEVNAEPPQPKDEAEAEQVQDDVDREILRLKDEGMRPKQIAQALGLGHHMNVMNRLRAMGVR